MVGCFEHGQSYKGNVSNETKPNYAESEGECQKQCQNDGSCKGFSYDSDRKHCSILAFKDMQRTSKAGYISGPKYCSGRFKNYDMSYLSWKLFCPCISSYCNCHEIFIR